MSSTRSCCSTPRPRATRSRIFRRRRQHRPDHPAAACRSSPTPRWCRPSRSRTPNSTSSSRSTAPPVRRRSRKRRAWSGAPGAASAPAKPICPEHTRPLLDLAQFTVPAPAQTDYLQVLARSLDLGRRGQGHRQGAARSGQGALHAGDVVPGYALSAGRAERHWRDDEPAAIAALQSLGLGRDDVVAEAMRSPKQVELRAKARGLKVPSEFIVSTSLRHLAGARRERARSDARPGRDRAVILRGTRSLPRRRQP